MRIFLNGQILSREEAKVSVLDRGFLYGDGVFETLRSYHGRIFRCEDHVQRLFRSAEAIRMSLPFSLEEIRDSLYRTLSANNLQDARIRISVTRGEGEPGHMDVTDSSPTVCIVATPFAGHPQEKYSMGVRADIVSTRQIPPEVLSPQAKSLNRLNLILAQMEIRGSGAEEAFLLTMNGQVAEGTTSNIFMVQGGVVTTPPLSLGILDGITRREVLRIATTIGIPVLEESFRPNDLVAAEECFITSTTKEVMPVVHIGGKAVGQGIPGKLTRNLLDTFRKWVESDSTGHRTR
jgi:branched-chain amino acid aminotransferase